MHRGHRGRKELESPPAHLQKAERQDKDHCPGLFMRYVKIEKIAEPGGGSPGLLGIPAPEIAPGLLCP